MTLRVGIPDLEFFRRRVGQMRRRRALRRGKPLAHGSQLERSTPLRPLNPERRARVRPDPWGPSGYRDHEMVRYPCLTCALRPTDQAHITGRSVGGQWYETVPMCVECHHVIQHGLGWDTFEERGGVTRAELHAAAWGIARDWITRALPEDARVSTYTSTECRRPGSAWAAAAYAAYAQRTGRPEVLTRLLSIRSVNCQVQAAAAPTLERIRNDRARAPVPIRPLLEHLESHFFMEVACRLLSNTVLHVWQITQGLGFSALHVFSRAFDRWAGVRPSVYRKQMRLRSDEAAAPNGTQVSWLRPATLVRASLGRLERPEADEFVGQQSDLYPESFLAALG